MHICRVYPKPDESQDSTSSTSAAAVENAGVDKTGNGRRKATGNAKKDASSSASTALTPISHILNEASSLNGTRSQAGPQIAGISRSDQNTNDRQPIAHSQGRPGNQNGHSQKPSTPDQRSGFQAPAHASYQTYKFIGDSLGLSRGRTAKAPQPATYMNPQANGGPDTGHRTSTKRPHQPSITITDTVPSYQHILHPHQVHLHTPQNRQQQQESQRPSKTQKTDHLVVPPPQHTALSITPNSSPQIHTRVPSPQASPNTAEHQKVLDALSTLKSIGSAYLPAELQQTLLSVAALNLEDGGSSGGKLVLRSGAEMLAEEGLVVSEGGKGDRGGKEGQMVIKKEEKYKCLQPGCGKVKKTLSELRSVDSMSFGLSLTSPFFPTAFFRQQQHR